MNKKDDELNHWDEARRLWKHWAECERFVEENPLREHPHCHRMPNGVENPFLGEHKDINGKTYVFHTHDVNAEKPHWHHFRDYDGNPHTTYVDIDIVLLPQFN